MRLSKLTTRRVIVWSVILLIIGAICYPLFTPLVDISQESVSRIEVGMALEQVEEIMGGREGIYDGLTGWGETGGFGKGSHGWHGLAGGVEVFLDRDNRVARKQLCNITSRSIDTAQLIWERLSRGIFR
jgi:hypothetical protein